MRMAYHIGWSLIKHTRKLTISHIELYKTVTRRQSHLGNIDRIPSGHDYSPIVRIVLDFVDTLAQLIDTLSGIVRVHVDVLSTEVTPLESVYGSQVALFSLRESIGVQELAWRVAVPDFNPLLREFFGVCRAPNEPEELFDDAF